MRKTILSLVLLVLISTLCFGFETGKNPTKAAVLSLAIPGGGQFYNEAYYKSVGVLSVQAFVISQTVYNHNLMVDYRDKMNSSEGEAKLLYESKFNQMHRRRQNDFWWLGSIAFLSIVDAIVDAHLYNFEDKRDEVHILFGGNKIGIGINF
ncbi:MAG: DUF5683 domain-containing protein [Candidatus Cloacimonas sp.]|jgi:hypothetical protein|nr:DUF5683 domain-containing protein [Candidatus Cloacimonadota bacterium]